MSSSSETVFFNPGALTKLDDKYAISSSLTAVYSKNRYQNVETGSTASTDNPIGSPINFYIANQFNDSLALGFGLYTPFGSRVEWEKDWVGSHFINNVALESIFLQPTVAYEINDMVSIGIGPIVAISSIGRMVRPLKRTL